MGDKLRRPPQREGTPLHAVEHGVGALAFLQPSMQISGFVLILVFARDGNHPGIRAFHGVVLAPACGGAPRLQVECLIHFGSPSILMFLSNKLISSTRCTGHPSSGRSHLDNLFIRSPTSTEQHRIDASHKERVD